MITSPTWEAAVDHHVAWRYAKALGARSRERTSLTRPCDLAEFAAAVNGQAAVQRFRDPGSHPMPRGRDRELAAKLGLQQSTTRFCPTWPRPAGSGSSATCSSRWLRGAAGRAPERAGRRSRQRGPGLPQKLADQKKLETVTGKQVEMTRRWTPRSSAAAAPRSAAHLRRYHQNQLGKIAARSWRNN